MKRSKQPGPKAIETSKPLPSGAAPCSPSSAHDKAWEKGFIVPIAKEMKARGVAYVLKPVETECPHNMGHELNGVGMWICLGCRADITPESIPENNGAITPAEGRL